MSRSLPICFVIMPYGTKSDSSGVEYDFDALYEHAIAPGIRGAGLAPLRSDMDLVPGLIQKSMFERLLLCDYAIADLTTANANVFYELGIRHAVRPHTTVCLASNQARIPFNIASLRTQPYQYRADGSIDHAALARALTKQLTELIRHRGQFSDSPLFNLLEGYEPPPIDRLKTDSFRDQIEYATESKRRLKAAREAGDPDQAVGELQAIEASLGSKEFVEAGILVDLMLSYRALSRHDEMERVISDMPEYLRRSRLVAEQHGFALNRLERWREALDVLEPIVAENGASSETCGLIGRVWKDQWRRASNEGKAARAAGFLDKAIDAYRRGFEADWRDAYPGVNLATLLEVKGDTEAMALAERVRPVVEFAAERRVNDGVSDYWDFATLVEVASLRRDEGRARLYTARSITSIEDRPFQPESTAGNLRLIESTHRRHGHDTTWLLEVIAEFEEEAKS